MDPQVARRPCEKREEPPSTNEVSGCERPPPTIQLEPYKGTVSESPKLSPWDLAESLWPKVTGARYKKEQDELGIGWIDDLPEKLQRDIDGDFFELEAGQPPVVMPPFKQSVVRPPQDTVPPWVVKVIRRVNFDRWATQLFGSREAAIAHFRGVQPVKGRPEMWLAEGARVAFERAMDAFERKFPGYTIVTTPVAFALRDRQMARYGLGMLYHAVGAINLKAYENPNLKLGSKGYSYRYLIEKFGGGPAGMSLKERDIESAEQVTRNGGEPHPVVQTVRDQFNAMAETSRRFQASMVAQLPQLHAVRERYFTAIPVWKGDGKSGTEEQQAEDSARKALQDIFKDCIRAIDADIAELQSSPGDRAKTEARIEELSWYRDNLPEPRFVFGKKRRAERAKPEAATAQLLSEPRYGERHRTRNVVLEGPWGSYTYDIVRDGPWNSYAFEDVPLAQLLDQGFLRDDPMKKPNNGERWGVFNAEVVATLAEYGFASGASFQAPNPMYFYYLPAAAVVPGGRSEPNMLPTAFSPEGPLPGPSGAPQK